MLGGAGTGMSLAQMTLESLFPHSDRIGSAVALERWSGAYAAGMVGMWWVMMVAMVTPSVAPIILLQTQAARHAEAKGAENAPALQQTGAFAAGYLLIWLAFSGAATFLQWALEAGGLLEKIATKGPLSARPAACCCFCGVGRRDAAGLKPRSTPKTAAPVAEMTRQPHHLASN